MMDHLKPPLYSISLSSNQTRTIATDMPRMRGRERDQSVVPKGTVTVERPQQAQTSGERGIEYFNMVQF